MLHIDIPGRAPLALTTLILDYNGTVACDGSLLPGVAPRLTELAQTLRVIVLTADTHGSVHRAMEGLPVEVQVIAGGDGRDETQAKLDVVRELDPMQCAAFGNGRNDVRMLEAAAVSVAVLGDEGLCAAVLSAAHVLVRHIHDGLDLLRLPQRLRATLRC